VYTAVQDCPVVSGLVASDVAHKAWMVTVTGIVDSRVGEVGEVDR
jgi:hypothetical protein